MRVLWINFLLTQDLYNAIIAENNKFKEYWNIHPEEVEEVCRKFSEKYEDMPKKRPTSIRGRSFFKSLEL